MRIMSCSLAGDAAGVDLRPAPGLPEIRSHSRATCFEGLVPGRAGGGDAGDLDDHGAGAAAGRPAGRGPRTRARRARPGATAIAVRGIFMGVPSR
ncbi:MAG: hypothetical protein MZV64_11355 [Ignavibacteriales bacterium]|nr:hypothetical protein [Ignavibacteriales bacterium]